MEKLRKAIRDIVRRELKISTRWVTVVSVDTGAKTMKAKGSSGVEYKNSLLGLGGNWVIPKVGAKCLVGIIEDKDAATFLIHADQVEEVNLKGTDLGGLIIYEKLFEELEKEKTRVDAIYEAITNAAVAPSDGGATFKSNMILVLETILEKGTYDDKLINHKVTHG